MSVDASRPDVSLQNILETDLARLTGRQLGPLWLPPQLRLSAAVNPVPPAVRVRARVAVPAEVSGGGAAAALACLAETMRLNVIENAAARGKQLYEGCLALQEKYDIIGDVN